MKTSLRLRIAIVGGDGTSHPRKTSGIGTGFFDVAAQMTGTGIDVVNPTVECAHWTG